MMRAEAAKVVGATSVVLALLGCGDDTGGVGGNPTSATTGGGASSTSVAASTADAASSDAATTGTGEGGEGSSTSTTGSGGGAAAPLSWFSDWRSGRGNASDALHDGGKWNGNLCDATELVEAVAAEGLDFPASMENVYRAGFAASAGPCYMLVAHQQWPAMQLGQYFFGRIYYRAAIGDGLDMRQSHPFQGRGPTDSAYLWFVNTTGVAPEHDWEFQLPGREYPYNRFTVPIETHATYRFELRMHWASEGTAKVSLRMYRSDVSLHADDDVFRGLDGADTLATVDPDVTVPNGAESFAQWELGNNDAGVVGLDQYQYWGGAAVRVSDRAEDWIGAYPTADEAP